MIFFISPKSSSSLVFWGKFWTLLISLNPSISYNNITVSSLNLDSSTIILNKAISGGFSILLEYKTNIY